MTERDNENDEPGVVRAGIPMDPLRLWNALRARWHWIFGAAVIGAFIGAAVAKKFLDQTFGAQAVLAFQGPTDTEVDRAARQTIVESVALHSNLEEVKKRMKVEMPTDVLRNFINISSNERTNIITIDGTWASADGAALLVNTLIDVFLDARQRIVGDRLKMEITRLHGAVQQAEQKYSEASQRYDDFRRTHGISDISQERELAIAQAAELAAQADTARAQASAAQSKLSEFKGDITPTPVSAALSEAEAKQADRDEKRLLEARRELDVAKIQYTADHPTVRRLTAEVGTLEQRVKSRYADKAGNSARRYAAAQQQAASAASRQKAAEEYKARLKERLNKLSAVEGQAAVLLGELRVADEALERAKQMLAGAELQVTRPPSEFQVLERAVPPEFALSSSRKRAALGFPIGFALLTALGIVFITFRRLDVRTPAEAAYWSKLPVIGASTWPRDPEMLSSLMHDLDDYAPQCAGVTLIVGVSLEEAKLARRVAEWDGHRMPKVHDVNRLLTSGSPLTVSDGAMGPGDDPSLEEGMPPNSMQILTLTGPVPAQALRRAARMADRVLVVVMSGKHDIFQLTKIRDRLGRESGIGLLLVGLEKDYAMVKDRVGPIESFWHATRAASTRLEA